MLSSAPQPEELPTLYRTILDLAAELEHSEARGEAARAVATASAAYSRGWGPDQRRVLRRVESQLRRRIDERNGFAGRRFRLG